MAISRSDALLGAVVALSPQTVETASRCPNGVARVETLFGTGPGFLKKWAG